ncbi:nitrogenase [Mastigocladus laminosus UU774]|nr:nitrogenase [Mastigocladus laminosus UU774]
MIRQLRRKLDETKVANPASAKILCWLIPASCPFERSIQVSGYTIHIPALCHLNPFYEQLVSLRFRALEYLAQH